MSKKSRCTRIKQRREKLWKQDPRCCYCHVETILPLDAIKKHNIEDPTKLNLLPREILNRIATIEHVYTKFDDRRYADVHGSPTTLACYKCNQEKGAQDFKTLPGYAQKLWHEQLGGFRRWYLYKYNRGEVTTPFSIQDALSGKYVSLQQQFNIHRKQQRRLKLEQWQQQKYNKMTFAQKLQYHVNGVRVWIRNNFNRFCFQSVLGL